MPVIKYVKQAGTLVQCVDIRAKAPSFLCRYFPGINARVSQKSSLPPNSSSRGFQRLCVVPVNADILHGNGIFPGFKMGKNRNRLSKKSAYIFLDFFGFVMPFLDRPVTGQQ